ncbi:hypothetical protein NQ314_006942 [Rhamnusium bicolor]|uniref:C3H1-type domain-containing protein n=1 Tax=Rhamnusium bicolor TaxID=1586634 RepID=A0AAV8YTF8_9CUCU|nr:hypothetical protein NQ314_006942 [Rhamnusium bicolor]
MKKVVCQTSKGENQREKFSMPQNEDNVFKLPLPPPKRPPTRPKRTVCNNQDSGKNLQIQFTNKHAEFGQMQENSFVVSKSDFSDDSLEFLEKEESDKFNMTDKDDIISIIASTIEGDNNEEISDRSQVESDSICAVNLEPLRKNSMESIGNLSYAEKRIQNWVQNVPDPDPPLLIQEKAKPLQLTHNHIIKMPPTSSKGNPRIFFKDIPVQFSGLCYFHYFNGNCARPKHCNLMHTIMKDKYTHRFQKSSPEDLSKAYDFSLAFEKLFKEIYSCFLVAFGILKMQKKLVSSIEDIFRIGSIDTTEALEFIVKGLETSGLSFLESIEMISFNVGFLQFPELGDILLDLITRKHNISENWDVIKRIAKARGHVSPTIVTRMLTRVTAVYPLNKHLCLEIYNVIIENKMTDLSQINEEFLAPFRTLAGFRDLTDTTEKPTVSVPSSRSLVHPPVIPSTKEQLAAHIDNNLIKEREWYEREVEGRTIRMTTIPIRPPEPGVGNYVSSYNYKSRNVTNNYDNPNHSSDSDDRYFMPKPMQHTFAQADHGLHSSGFSSPFMGNHVFSGPESTVSNIGVEHSTFSPCSSLHFEPPPLVSKYVPETVRKNDARPIFGNFRCRSDFKLDRSLHNLLPDTIEHVSINERDIAKLDGVIKSKNGSEFCKLLERYRSPATIQNFITMMIAHLKSCNAMYEVLLGLVDSIESIKPDYDKDRHIKAVVEVVVMNLLFELERKGLWFKARKLLEKFCDWDSLISSQKDTQGSTYDAHCLFNPMLISLMNEQQISLLKQFYPDIDIYYKVMDKNVLRAYTILLADQLGQEELYRLYELCCERQIYTYFKIVGESSPLPEDTAEVLPQHKGNQRQDEGNSQGQFQYNNN